MGDLAKSLRGWCVDYTVKEGVFVGPGTVMNDAADEIERLEAEVERWKFNEEVQMQRAIKAEAEVERKTSALRRINNCAAAHEYDAKAMREIARAALEDK